MPGQVDAVVAALRPWQHGALPNFVGHAEPGGRAAMWSEADRQRLLATAHRYDPQGLFGAADYLG